MQMYTGLVEKLRTIRVGDPMDPETQMSTLVSERAAVFF